jgi:hypothetical protein
MRKRLAALVAVVVSALVVTGSALAFDCIRVSSSYQGLVQSTTNSGNWTLFDFSSPAALEASLTGFGVTLTSDQAQCAYNAYAASGQAQFFALGTGVAGGKKTSTNSQGARANADGFGVIAWNNHNLSVLGNGKGIDHLEASGIFPALMAAAASCNIDIPEE